MTIVSALICLSLNEIICVAVICCAAVEHRVSSEQSIMGERRSELTLCYVVIPEHVTSNASDSESSYRKCEPSRRRCLLHLMIHRKH